MPAKPSGKVKTRTVKVKQKNGDLYVVERQTLYNPEKKYEQSISSKLLGKILAGSTEMIPTRPRGRHPDPQAQAADVEEVCAQKMHVGMMDILAHVGRVSGIDALLYNITDKGTAQKIISVARYLVATDGDTLPGIVNFQYMHPLPYEEGLSEDIYHELFWSIGRNETLEQAFFLGRSKGLGDHPALAFDSTSISTYSNQLLEAKYGYSKDHEGLPVIKYIVFYSVFTKQPIAFWKLDGNISDVSTVANAMKRLDVLGIKGAELVTDNGYYAAYNIADMCKASFNFITLVKRSYKWVRAAIDTHRDKFNSMSSAVPFDTGVHGVCVPGMRTFKRPRLYANHKTGQKKGDLEKVTRRTYLHLYYDASRKAMEDNDFESRILAVRECLESGVPFDQLTVTMQTLASRYLIIRKRAGRTIVTFNEEACAEHKQYTGFFALLANREKDPFEALRIYRHRALIELYFRDYKEKVAGKRPRVWADDTLEGRMFVQFVALCYREYFGNMVAEMKPELGVPNGDEEHDTQKNLDIEKKLREWLDDQSLHRILEWFETSDCTRVSIKLRSKRFDPEIIARDKLFLKKLGMEP